MKNLITSLKSGNWRSLVACFLYFDTGFTVWVLYGPLAPAAYVAIRISDQINYYQGRAAQLDSRLRRAQWSTLGLGGLATVLAALGAQLWVPLATALTAAIATYLEYQQVGPTLAKSFIVPFMNYAASARWKFRPKTSWISLSE